MVCPEPRDELENERGRGVVEVARRLVAQQHGRPRRQRAGDRDALLLGAEKYGISDAAAPYIDQRISVPMLGMVESFNVSVACAIILAEARRQREDAGFYRERRLPDERYYKLLFEWTQPLLAKYCQKHSLPYPQLDEKGDITDPNWREERAL